MLRNLSAVVNGFVSPVFPERRIILRSERSASYLRFSPAAQCLTAVLLAATVVGGGWLAATNGAAAARAAAAEDATERLRAGYEARIAALKARERGLAEALSEARGEAFLAIDRLARQHSSLSEAVAAERQLASALQLRRRELDSLEGEHDATVQVCEATTNRVTALEVDIHRLKTENATLAETVTALNDTLNRVAEERDSASAEEAQLTLRIEDLSAEISAGAARRERVLEQLEEAAQLSLGAMEGVLEKSGVKVEPILDAVRREFSGQGGPFLPAEDVEALTQSGVDISRIAPLMSDLERLNVIRVALERLPFARPTRGARQTSLFGYRRDPVNGRKGFHSGTDFAGPRGTPIHATGPGEVVEAGWVRGYGRLVKVKHAFGYETVYAHLHRIRVKVGDTVERGDRIGDMGNSGRSTGTHLHYEVRINGKAVNPVSYIEAARHVL